MANEDFVSFEKALRELKIQSAELKKLVSEGDIRAFRDGDSMKFKREDLDALGDREDDDEFMFADSLEDDTGMVTEELSDEDTLLADDDDDALEDSPRVRASTTRSQRARGLDEEEAASEPAWVTAIAVVGCVVMLYGFFVIYGVAMESSPGGLTGIFATK